MNFKMFLCSLLLLTVFSSTLSAQTRIIAHRGYWDCEGSAQNSLFALKKAQELQVYGSEFDVIISSDGVPVIHHDPKIDGLLIENTPFDQIKNLQLKNGEKLPTLESYLKQGKKNKKVKLILEIKPHSTPEKESQAVAIITKMVKKYKVEKQMEYISFSLFICRELVKSQSGIQVAYLDGDLSPEEIKKEGLTGIDYNQKVFQTKTTWLQEAKQLGLSVNIWTVNDPKLAQEFAKEGADFLTTDKPSVLKSLIP